MYTQDYDETFPTLYARYSPLLPDFPSEWGVHSWKVAVYPYVKNHQIWVCPSMAKQGGSGSRWMYHPTKGGYGGNMPYVFCYAPSVGANYPYGPDGGGPVNMSCIAHPARTILIGESKHRDYVHYDPSRIDWYLRFDHNEMMNASFVDGHAKAMSRGRCAEQKWWDPRVED